MAQKPIKAVVTQVKIGLIEIEGLMLPDGSYDISQSQVAALKVVPPNRSKKQLEALTGMKFQSHQKMKKR